MENEPTNIPAQLAAAIVSIPKGLTPGVVKALDRLLGAAIDIPVAWLNQKKAQIDAKTESYKAVEAAIAQTAATRAGTDPDTTQRAMNVLIGKSYRKQVNRDRVAFAMVEDMREFTSQFSTEVQTPPPAELDDDWLNVFERYAEDASSERMQSLWGRVLAGEIRRPGRYSTRTLRFLSEFSQTDALNFEEFSRVSFGDIAPRKLVIPTNEQDISQLAFMEANGLVQGGLGLGFHRRGSFSDKGWYGLREHDLQIVFKGEPKREFEFEIILLTPLGQELLSLVPSRDPRQAARAVASAIRMPEMHEAYIGVVPKDGGKFQQMEVLWMREDSASPVVDGNVVPSARAKR